MNKLNYIVKCSQNALHETDVNALVFVYKNNFVRPEVVLGQQNTSIDSVQTLLNNNYVEASGDGLMVTEKGVDLILDAAELWANENNPDLLEVKKTRTKRGVTDEMEATAEYIKEQLLSIGIDFKSISEDRSNLIVKFKRVKTLKQIDVRRDGQIRVHAYNTEQKIVKQFTDVGFSVKVGGLNTYIDNHMSTENIQHVINILK